MNIIDHKRLDCKLDSDQIAWGNNVLSKVENGGLYGAGLETYGLYQFFHKEKELHYLNGQLDDMFYLVATIFNGLGYSIVDERRKCSKSKVTG